MTFASGIDFANLTWREGIPPCIVLFYIGGFFGRVLYNTVNMNMNVDIHSCHTDIKNKTNKFKVEKNKNLKGKKERETGTPIHPIEHSTLQCNSMMILHDRCILVTCPHGHEPELKCDRDRNHFCQHATQLHSPSHIFSAQHVFNIHEHWIRCRYIAFRYLTGSANVDGLLKRLIAYLSSALYPGESYEKVT